MNPLLNTLETLKRPRLLISAARIGASDYQRDTHLARHLKRSELPDCAQALEQLLQLEDQLNTDRQHHTNGYSAARHVEVLIAIMNEAQMLRELCESKSNALSHT